MVIIFLLRTANLCQTTSVLSLGTTNACPAALLSPLWWHLCQGASPDAHFLRSPSFSMQMLLLKQKASKQRVLPLELALLLLSGHALLSCLMPAEVGC